MHRPWAWLVGSAFHMVTFGKSLLPRQLLRVLWGLSGCLILTTSPPPKWLCGFLGTPPAPRKGNGGFPLGFPGKPTNQGSLQETHPQYQQRGSGAPEVRGAEHGGCACGGLLCHRDALTDGIWIATPRLPKAGPHMSAGNASWPADLLL